MLNMKKLGEADDGEYADYSWKYAAHLHAISMFEVQLQSKQCFVASFDPRVPSCRDILQHCRTV